MLTLTTPIIIDGVETTPDEYMSQHATIEQRDTFFTTHIADGVEASIEYWLDLFHDHIANKSITYEIIEDGNEDNA